MSWVIYQTTILKTSSWLNVASGLQLYWKRDPYTGVFLWILRNFLEHLFYRTTLDDNFWAYEGVLFQCGLRSIVWSSFLNSSIDIICISNCIALKHCVSGRSWLDTVHMIMLYSFNSFLYSFRCSKKWRRKHITVFPMACNIICG